MSRQRCDGTGQGSGCGRGVTQTHQPAQEHSSALHWHAPLAHVQSADVPVLQGQAMVNGVRCVWVGW